MTHAEYAELGGFEGAEVIMWLVMRGALSAQVRKLHQSYYLPSMTGIATAIYENEATRAPMAGDVQRATARTWPRSSRGVEKLPGTYPFTLERSVKALSAEQVPARPDRARRIAQRFLADPEARVRRGRAHRRRTRPGARAATGAA